jgi:uncharacterized protein (DUF1697 family)
LEAGLPTRSKPSEVYVGLLRGVNVGGKNKLPMKDLAEILAKSGCAEVKTYIQSGNVVFTAPESPCDDLPRKIATQVEKRFGHKPPMTIRSMQQMLDIVRHNPYVGPGMDESRVAVLFLADTPTAENVAKLDPDRSPGDEFTVRGSEIYLFVGKNGFAKSKLTNAYFDSKLATMSTGRNWRTTVTLLGMMESLAHNR